MGLGRDLGNQLRLWLAADAAALHQSRALTNRLLDALGAEEALKGPIRDLSSQPLLLQALHEQGARQRTALTSLSRQLSHTYAPAVLAELLDLLEAATALELPRPAAPNPPAEPLSTLSPTQTPPQRALRSTLEAIAPGVALAAGGALVAGWIGQELDRALFEGWGWSGGVVLVLTLGLVQALASGPLKVLHRRWPLRSEQAVLPQHAWRWLSAAWIHTDGREAAINLVLLLVLLGASPLQLRDVILRYGLTALACLLPAVLGAERFGVQRQWSGAAGPISALIALAAGLSLLHWRMLHFSLGSLAIPAWVLLLAYGALQLGWQLPRQPPDQSSLPWQRLLASTWFWGLLLGLGWAVISRLQELL